LLYNFVKNVVGWYIYVKVSENRFIILILYVDDIFICY